MDINTLIRTAEENPPAPPLRAGTLPGELGDFAEDGIDAGWKIETLQSADWALQRLAECEAEAEEVERQAAAAIDRIRRRAEALKLKASRGAGFFRFKLSEYAETHRKDLVPGKKKSRDFVHGRIGWRKKGGGLEVVDKAALCDWLATQPVEKGLYRMTLAPEMRALQTQFKETGEVFPGCEVRPEYDEIHIEADAPERALEE
jgi:phage host-nuclease inhibitor protein Gam